MSSLAQKKKSGLKRRKAFIYCIMLAPSLLLSILFHDIPLVGIQLAFRNFTYNGGIFNSDWVGFKNFELLFKSHEFSRLLINTILYSVATLLIVNLASGIIAALLMYEIRGRRTMKVVQTSTMIPHFISIVAVSYILFLIIDPSDMGVLNTVLKSFGMEKIDLYSREYMNWWPVIIVVVNLWMQMGMAALYNYGALLAIDPCLYEAASLDGANWFQKARHVSIPGMSSMICMTLITQTANILNSSMGNFYLTKGFGAANGGSTGPLMPTTDVIATYTYRHLNDAGAYGTTAAIGLFTSVVGVLLMILTNRIIKKLDEDKSMF